VNGICEAVESEPTTCNRLTLMLTLATTDKKKTQKQKEEARPPAGQPDGCPKGDRQPTAAGRKPARPRFLKQVGT